MKPIDKVNQVGERISDDTARVDVGGGGDYDGTMDGRLTKLEEFAADARERLVKIESRLEQSVTKNDLAERIGDLKVEIHKSSNEQIRWIVGTAIVLAVASVTVMTFVLNNAVPKAPPALTPPVVVYLQPPPPPTPPTPQAPKP